MKVRLKKKEITLLMDAIDAAVDSAIEQLPPTFRKNLEKRGKRAVRLLKVKGKLYEAISSR